MYVVGNVYAIAAVAVIGGALFGFDISSMSAIISTKEYLCYFNKGPLYFESDGKCSGPEVSVQGGITASMPGGSFCGALFSGWISDKLGRRMTIQIGAGFWVLGSVIVCASQNIPMLIVGRFVNGVAVGICSAQVPVYITELAPPSKRGRLVGFQQWAITWGILIMFYISYGCSHIEGTAAFRLPWGLQAIPGLLLGLAMMLLPESPRWLARNDRWEEAKAVLTLVHAEGNQNSPFVEREMSEIRITVEFERANANVSWLELFTSKMINRTHIGVFTQIWSQLTGMNVMMYYITYVFSMAGLSSSNLLVSSVTFIVNVLFTIPALKYVDRWGRRPTLLVGALLMMLLLLINGSLFAAYSKKPAPNQFPSKAESMFVEGVPAIIIVVCTYLFVASFAPTWGPVSWIYPSELFPLRVRGKAVALATSSNWAFNFALAYFVPPAFANIRYGVYFLFAGFCALMFAHVYFFFPETSQKPLEEIEDMFDDTRAGSTKFIGTKAWTTSVGRNIRAKGGDIEDNFGERGSNKQSAHAVQEIPMQDTPKE